MMGGNSTVDATHSDSARDEAENRIVLIAEDEEPISEAIAVIVEEVGFRPLLAANGQEALELALTYHPKLVITDLMMPYMDGIRLMEELRAAAATTDGYDAPPIVLMSAAGIRRVQDSGADAILRKPFDIEEVERLLTRFLGPAGKH